MPTLPVGTRHDLVYLVGWEQSVSATEDSELLEQALGGLDTSARVRRMHRVYVRPDGPATCSDAFAALVTQLVTGGHSFDSVYHELKSGARLTVSAADPGPADELCNLPGAPGYRGAENQAIRVQLIAPDRFLWSYDNGAPLYRVTASAQDGVVTVVFRTPPQQQAFFPLKGQVLELLPWGSLLPNGEHIADHPIAPDIGGDVLARVLTSYNPSTKTLTATLADPPKLAAMLTWLEGQPTPAEERFLFVRVWNPGDAAPEAEFGVPFDPAGAPLAGTGLKVTFNQNGIVGDYWILGARPSTPDQVVPWELESGAAPHGPRRFYSPLALLHWSQGGDGLTVKVESCRRTFRPLTRIGGCCTVTVGDGVTSFGDYRSIQEAILALPSGEPGKVCVRPGVYRERVVINGRNQIVLEGCGARTILRTPPGNDTSQGLITILQSFDITLRNFSIEATGQFGVTVLEAVGQSATTRSRRVTLEQLAITTRRDASLPTPTVGQLQLGPGSAPFPLATIAAVGVHGLEVVRCTLRMIGDLSAAANVLLARCTSAVVRDCQIWTPPGEGTVSKAWGGVHIAGDCDDILVERNDIREGLGHGITLGSVRALSTPIERPDLGTRYAIAAGEDCPGTSGELPLSAGPPGGPPLIADEGPTQVQIRHNRIHAMGSSGVSVLGFWPETAGDVHEQIRTSLLVIADNIIEGNFTRPPEDALPPGFRDVAAFGGIVLAEADDLRIHDNRIQGNGADHLHPVCGIYVLHGENIVVENNQIHDNGRRFTGSALAGHRAGIALQLVGRRIELARTYELDRMHPAARVRGNVVVQPAGRALQVYGIGPMFVEGNILVSEGLDGLSSSELLHAAHCVEIQNIGQSADLVRRNTIPANVGIFPAPPLLYNPGQPSDELIDGRILFTDNQVRFNPVSGAAEEIFCATRLQSYGDIAVLGNQFIAKFPAGEGSMVHDTVVTGWSVRASHNRWEDPAYTLLVGGPIVTTASAVTLAFLNITTLNQASRCIHADISPGSQPAIAVNQIVNTTGCDLGPPLNTLLQSPP